MYKLNHAHCNPYHLPIILLIGYLAYTFVCGAANPVRCMSVLCVAIVSRLNAYLFIRTNYYSNVVGGYSKRSKPAF